jgi:hypothetical protein
MLLCNSSACLVGCDFFYYVCVASCALVECNTRPNPAHSTCVLNPCKSPALRSHTPIPTWQRARPLQGMHTSSYMKLMQTLLPPPCATHSSTAANTLDSYAIPMQLCTGALSRLFTKPLSSLGVLSTISLCNIARHGTSMRCQNSATVTAVWLPSPPTVCSFVGLSLVAAFVRAYEEGETAESIPSLFSTSNCTQPAPAENVFLRVSSLVLGVFAFRALVGLTACVIRCVIGVHKESAEFWTIACKHQNQPNYAAANICLSVSLPH